MRIYQIQFSPTGGTQAVLRFLGAPFGEPEAILDLTDPQTDLSRFSFQKEDVCLAAVPSYGGRVPDLAVKGLEKLTGNGALAVPVVVYGNRAYDDTLLELRDCLIRQGFRCFAAVAAVAEHSIMRQFGTGRPDAADALELNSFGEAIKKALARISSGGQDLPPISVPGHFPYIDHKPSALIPLPGPDCSGCGKCARLCPAQAIDPQDPANTDRERCIACMRCVSVCPSHSRQVNPELLEKLAGRLGPALAQPKENQCFLPEE